MTKARPLPWWPRDFAADEHVIPMSLEAEGAYHRLLDYQWLHESIPADIRKQAAICKHITAARMAKLWRELAVCFVTVEGDPSRLQNRRIERVRQEAEAFRQKQSENGKKGAAKTWGKDGSDVAPPIAPPMASPSSGLWPPSPSPTPTTTTVPRSIESTGTRSGRRRIEKSRLFPVDARAGFLQLAQEARTAKASLDASTEARVVSGKPP